MTTPEELEATETIKLFVDVFTDFYKIREPGHSMLKGPRGCGKSMMFRYLEPDCQRLARNCELRDLPFFAVLVSIKKTDLNLTELRRLTGSAANIILNEHFLTMYVGSKVFSYIAKLGLENCDDFAPDARHFFENALVERLRRCGYSGEASVAGDATVTGVFEAAKDLCDQMYDEVCHYIKQLAFSPPDQLEFAGPLCGYLDFLYPVLSELLKLPFMPDGPIYLLIDDADVLNYVQTRILNSWISTRTSSEVSIKVSTQLRYKTYRTSSGSRIDTPHDYSEVNIADLYTTRRGRYLERVREIIRKRLALFGIERDPGEFFPVQAVQEQRIKELKEQIRLGEHEVSGRGYRPSDDALRYARPLYIAGLGGTRKSSSKYSYAGFEQLVHISSGLIRYFLEPAALMYSMQQARVGEQIVTQLEPVIQNQVIRDASERLMISEFEKISSDDDGDNVDEQIDVAFQATKMRLRNVIEALGGTFRRKLVSDDAERRVFSVACSDRFDPAVVEVLELGVSYGYFHRSTVGNKDGTGRTALYILTRRLAPYFNLDPSGFAGYLFVTNDQMHEAMKNPMRLLRRMKEEGVDAVLGEERQLPLFS